MHTPGTLEALHAPGILRLPNIATSSALIYGHRLRPQAMSKLLFFIKYCAINLAFVRYTVPELQNNLNLVLETLHFKH